jgi:hypothetical protein
MNPSTQGDGGEYFGRYRAFVRDVSDPEKKGRVRCFCPAVMGENDSTRTWLGWAEVSHSFGTKVEGDSGMLNVPEVGTPVWLEFQQGSPDFPVVVGAITTGTDETNTSVPRLGTGHVNGDDHGTDRVDDGITVPGSSCAPVYPHNRVLKTASGHIVEVDETPGAKRIRVQHPSGTFVEMTEPGSFVKQVIGDLLVWVGQKMKIRAVQDAMISVGGILYLGGSDGSATKRVAHQDSQVEDHDHSVVMALVAPPGGGAVTGTITIQPKIGLKIAQATCATAVKVKP